MNLGKTQFITFGVGETNKNHAWCGGAYPGKKRDDHGLVGTNGEKRGVSQSRRIFFRGFIDRNREVGHVTGGKITRLIEMNPTFSFSPAFALKL